MLKFEHTVIEWINDHMIYFALGFVLIVAVWIRAAGCDYVGNDYHFSLYDIPENCQSFLYRSLVGFLMERSEFVVILLKCFSYAGDFAVAMFAMLFWRQRHSRLNATAAFFLLTACLLSPVILIYSMGGMKVDSLCMTLLLAGILCFRKKWFLPAAFAAALAAFLSPAYWPVVIILSCLAAIKQKKEGTLSLPMAAALLCLLCLLVLSVFLENRGMDNGYFWGKLFVFNPLTRESYAGPGQWLTGMVKLYGYLFATGSLLLAFDHRKMRLPALALQLAVLLYVGWQQTYALAI